MNNYLDLARLGRNEWWRYVIGFFIILLFWQIIGAIPSVLLIIWVTLDGNPQTDISPEGIFAGINANISFIAMLMASCAFMVGLFLVVRFLHQRKFLTLITSENILNWRRLFQGFFIWFLLAGVSGWVEAIIFPDRYAFTFEPERFIPFIILALILIPIQTSAEELFFRGYLLQGLGLRIRSIFILSGFSGVVFMVPHLLNPEAKSDYLLMGIYYFSIGTALAFITLRDGGLELALGMHMANNLFSGLIANAVVTVMPTPSMFTIMELDVVYTTAASLISIGIFVFVFLGPMKRKKWDERPRPEKFPSLNR